ncbi:MAG: flagellar motor switch protein FliN [Kordiimonadales bacterium]|nr:MAG: flagellar motor switch protein FliN [Kordiimonadales bacterium]
MADEDDTKADMNLQDLASHDGAGDVELASKEDGIVRTAKDLEPMFDVPVQVQAVLGKASLEVNQLLKLAPGAVVELDRKVGEAIDIYVNNRLVARGEVVLVEEHLGVTMTEIIKIDGASNT